jgi:hypothetical protein
MRAGPSFAVSLSMITNHFHRSLCSILDARGLQPDLIVPHLPNTVNLVPQLFWHQVL